jgi:hypothetical protein
MAWSILPTFALDQIFGYQTANKITQNLVTLVSRRTGRDLGGSRVVPNEVSYPLFGAPRGKPSGLGPSDAYDYVDIEIDGTNQGGLTYQARVEVRVADPGVSITPKIRNLTDGTDAGTGVACSATALDYSGTNQKQTIAITLASGIKKYRLQYTVSNVSFQTWMVGELESFTTS